MQTVTEFNVREIEKAYSDFEAKLKKFMDETINITRDEFTKILPEFSKTEAKLKVVKKMPANLTNANIVTYFKKQTMGKDFINFKFLSKELELAKDKAGMLVFNNSFKHTNVKKEALFVWWIMEFVNTHPFLKRYRYKPIFDAKLQESFDSIISGRRGKKYDLVFTNLNIIVEIDETHTMSEILNDNVKDSLAKMNGSKLIRLSVPDMFEGISYDTAPGNVAKMLEFRGLLETALISSLVRFEEYRKEYITFMFKKSIRDDIDEIYKDIKIKINNNADKKRIQGLKNHLNKKIKILESMDTDKVAQLFALKHKSGKRKNIAFQDVTNLFDFITEKELYDTILNNGLFDDDDMISWKDLSILILMIDDDKIYDYRDILAEYYNEVELLYEIITKDIVLFYEDIISSPENYQTYARSIEENKFGILNTDLEKISSKLEQVKIENSEYKNKLSFYEKRDKANKILPPRIVNRTNCMDTILYKVEDIEYDFITLYKKDKIFYKDIDKVKNTIKNTVRSLKEKYSIDEGSTNKYDDSEAESEIDDEEFITKYKIADIDRIEKNESESESESEIDEDD